jgi:transposase
MNQVHPLTADEVQELHHLHRQTIDANVRSRCDMILWSNEGLSPPEIAQRVRFSHDTVSRYIARYEAEGISGLLTRSRSGRPHKVTAEYEALLLDLVAQKPREVGMPFSNWTTANLADELAQRTGIEISPRQVENYLKCHDWRLRRPVHTVKHKQDAALVDEKKSDS